MAEIKEIIIIILHIQLITALLPFFSETQIANPVERHPNRPNGPDRMPVAHRFLLSLLHHLD
jgi:hypothetical protein